MKPGCRDSFPPAPSRIDKRAARRQILREMSSEQIGRKSRKANSVNGKRELSNQPEKRPDTGETSVQFGPKIPRGEFLLVTSQVPSPRCFESELGW